MFQKRTLYFFLVAIFILVTTYLLIKIAQGYKLDLSGKTFHATGLLVATSNPDGAKVWVNEKLTGATNSTFSLTPGNYLVEIKKDGYYPWKKNLQLEKELVTKSDALLFPLVPDLTALTFTGAENPVISLDGSKIVYRITEQGIWILDLNDLFLGLNQEPKQILKSSPNGRNLSLCSYRWSPDSKQILLTYTNKKIIENFMLETNTLVLESALKDITKNLFIINLQWAGDQKLRSDQKLRKLPPTLTEIVNTKTKDLHFSPDETKVLYTATASAQIPDNLIPSVQGASTQKQERTLQPDHTYIYDIKEDRNFLIGQEGYKLSWFPTSKHLLLVEKNKITIMEYDNANRTVVYNAPFVNLYAFPLPSTNKIMILTTISSDPKAPANLYAVSLK